MKKTIYPSVLSLSLLLAACGGGSGGGGGFPILGGGTTNPGTTTPTTPATPTKNVIFFLGDGMGITTMTAARIYQVGEDGELTMDKLPETAFVHTYSADGQVTDSAPSMAAYMTGVKMNNEVISMSADTKAVDASGKAYYDAGFNSTCPSTGNGTPAETLLEQMKTAGYGTGIVSTARITHATPATTYSHVCHRDAESTIAAALVPGGAGFNAKLGSGIDVILGGGSSYFTPKESGGVRTDKRDLVAELKAAKYSFATDTKSFNALPADGATRIAGLFTKSH